MQSLSAFLERSTFTVTLLRISSLHARSPTDYFTSATAAATAAATRSEATELTTHGISTPETSLGLAAAVTVLAMLLLLSVPASTVRT
jgi:hypothetical protein